MKQLSISLSGRIDKNYQVPPNSRIVLESGAVFNGEEVGGQILYNNSGTPMSFTINDGEIELTKMSNSRFVKIQALSEKDFPTLIVPQSKIVVEEEVALSGDVCTLHVPLIFTT